MKLKNQPNRLHGLTLIEVLVVVIMMTVFVALILPVSSGNKNPATIARCLNNLKQIGLAELLWAEDHKGAFPALVSTNQEGTMEFVAHGQLNRHLQCLASYQPNLSVFHCPSDSRNAAINHASLENTNISYFASLDASPSNSNYFLSGDRNLQVNGIEFPTTATVTTNTRLTWSKGMHYKNKVSPKGILLFPDGHVEVVIDQKFPALIAGLGTATNRLVFP